MFIVSDLTGTNRSILITTSSPVTPFSPARDNMEVSLYQIVGVFFFYENQIVRGLITRSLDWPRHMRQLLVIVAGLLRHCRASKLASTTT
jgi:hypothetical protein